jgi:secreted trypsin-like serine protease
MTNALHLLCVVVLSSMAHARLSQSRRAIVNGEDADFGRYPYMATLVRFVPNKSRHTCGGSLIAPDIVLTAGKS